MQVRFHCDRFLVLAALVNLCSVLSTEDVVLKERHLVLSPKRAKVAGNWR